MTKPPAHPLPNPSPPDWERVLAEVRSTAHRAVLRSGADPSEADDVAQIVVERIWRRWDEPHIRTARNRERRWWLNYLGVAARRALSDLRRSEGRRRGRELAAVSPIAGPPLPARPGHGQHATLTAPTSLDEIDDYLAQLTIAEVAHTQLTGRQRRIGQALFIDGWTVGRTAEHLGVSERTVRSDRRSMIAIIRDALLADDGHRPADATP
ncbi:MAG: sigma-70 family RNA polymerase sigma factor [Acidimicrobiales bacterium]